MLFTGRKPVPTRMLRRAGVPLRPRGAGRFRPARRTADPAGLPQFMAELYEVAGFSSGQIAVIMGMPERTVRDRLRRYGIRTAVAAAGTARTAGWCPQGRCAICMRSRA